MKKRKIILFIFLISLIMGNILYKNIFAMKQDLVLNKDNLYLLASTSINEKISKKMNDVDLKEATIKEDKKIIRKVNKTSESEKLGTVGRLFLPSIDLNVAVYNANLNTDENYNAQSIVDKVDSAAYFKLGSKEVIADHNYQGFNKLMNMSLNTNAYIKKTDGTITNYQMINKFIGKNISTDLIDSNGKNVIEYDGQLIIYTCYNSYEDILITIWKTI